MILKIKHFVIFITLLGFVSCKQESSRLVKIEGKQIAIDSTFTKTEGIEEFITPYRNRINEVLDSTLAYAPKSISKEDGEFNTTAGNLMADIVRIQANPIFKSRTGKDIDIVLLNHGGIRSVISKGKVTARNAFEVMPFENTIKVAAIKGEYINDMVTYLIQSGRAHPISGMQVVLDKNRKLKKALIQGKPIDPEQTYYVATSDYLITGGDHMDFFKNNTSITDTDYLIRNAMIDYFKKVDTLAPVIDDRFYMEK
ncbi:5'-nucleotidase C-terminal domain-containing protein [Maribacter polysiphoniae]|uniref:5'-nucleotidase C-terminal domain-containing protein n=1 Tax=Maribacter polysiphoniae TaxID=429344 RepID=UPI002356AC85|nr:5'-nucleotidase [Maribacter polysiphoniae]